MSVVVQNGPVADSETVLEWVLASSALRLQADPQMHPPAILPSSLLQACEIPSRRLFDNAAVSIDTLHSFVSYDIMCLPLFVGSPADSSDIGLLGLARNSLLLAFVAGSLWLSAT